MPSPLPALGRRRLQCYLALLLGDALALLGGMAGVGLLHGARGGLHAGMVLGQLVLPLFLTLALTKGAYSIRSLQSPGLGMARASGALLLAGMAFTALTVMTGSDVAAWRTLLVPGLLGAVLLGAAIRLALRPVVRWRCGGEIVNALAIDDGGPPIPGLGTRTIRAAELDLMPALDDPHALHRIGMVLRHADRVIVSCPPERRAGWATVLKSANVSGEIVDDRVAELGALGARMQHGHGLLAVSIGPLGLRARLAKRLFDVIVASLALLALWPLLALAALAIRAEDGGQVVFAQLRLGQGNRFFRIYKFRTMQRDRCDGLGRASTLRGDPRVTRVGQFLRRTSLDELPQLVNVLRGEMSLVGPRPHAIASQAGAKLFWEVDQRYWLRHALKPGMTGLAQVRGWRGATESETDLAGRLAADLEYLHGWSLWRDVRILVATLRVLIHDRAY